MRSSTNCRNRTPISLFKGRRPKFLRPKQWIKEAGFASWTNEGELVNRLISQTEQKKWNSAGATVKELVRFRTENLLKALRDAQKLDPVVCRIIIKAQLQANMVSYATETLSRMKEELRQLVALHVLESWL